MNSAFGVVDGKPDVVRHEHVNLGLAVDVEKSDGSRTLARAEHQATPTRSTSPAFHAAYEELIAQGARRTSSTPDDFAGTTGTITNPGTIGTMHSVPRLMPGQGFIIGVGAIGYPAEYEGADPQTLAELGVSKIDHAHEHVRPPHHPGRRERRVPRASCTSCSLGERRASTTTIFQSFAVPYEPARWSVDISPARGRRRPRTTRPSHVQQLINMYRVRGHLIANLDPLGRKEPQTHPELDINHYGLTIWDLDREFPTGGLAGKPVMKLRDILGVLRDAYARTIGVEYMHIQEPDQKAWIQERVEGVQLASRPTTRSAGSSSGSTPPRRSSASCTRSTSGTSASASRAPRR